MRLSPRTMPRKPTFDHPFDQYAAYHGLTFQILDGPFNGRTGRRLTPKQAQRNVTDADRYGDIEYRIRLSNGKVLIALIEEIHADFSWGSNVNDERTLEERQAVHYGD